MTDKRHADRSQRLRILPTGDPNSAFQSMTAEETLAALGPPQSLLSSSAKAEKCGRVGVLNKVLYLTSGVFCPQATDGCRRSCLGHTSGRMQLPSSSIARDRRAAFLSVSPKRFMTMLRGELTQFSAEASQRGLMPAVRLNGTSDIPWERFAPGLFDEFAELQFFDYTKIAARMKQFLAGRRSRKGLWPLNYHLTFSADERNLKVARAILRSGGNVAAVFEPSLPQSWWGFPVIDGDVHDARFLDDGPAVVGLRAKGVAKVDLSGFVIRVCQDCIVRAQQLELEDVREDSHRVTVHCCLECGRRQHSRWTISGGMSAAA